MLIENTNKQQLVLRKSHGELKQMSAHKGAQAGRAAWRLLETQPKAVTEPFSPAKSLSSFLEERNLGVPLDGSGDSSTARFASASEIRAMSRGWIC